MKPRSEPQANGADAQGRRPRSEPQASEVHKAGFEFLDAVTSDLAFRAHGPTIEAVFSASADALLAATLENPESLRESVLRSLELRERDAELLLLRFLNELVYLRDAEGLLLRVRAIRIRRSAEVELDAELAGEPLDRARHALAGEVKATTAHALRVAPVDGGWEATATFDV